jgi:oligopeptide transport system ATP-binding protein
MYNGNIVEYGTCREIFADPRHPYTWALLSSLPQLTEKHTELYTIKGNPPSLNEVISGDPFAKRNEYALAIDFKFNPPLFAVSPTHYARTWLLDKRAPKIKIPNQILLLKKGIKNE